MSAASSYENRFERGGSLFHGAAAGVRYDRRDTVVASGARRATALLTAAQARRELAKRLPHGADAV